MSKPALPDPTLAIAGRIKVERAQRGWSQTDLAQRSGVSKAMISKIERGEASPTATVLGRLSGALGLALSVLLALAEQSGKRISRRADQVVWQDPVTGYTRRMISPPGGGVLEHLEIELPALVRVPYPASAFSFHHEQIIVTQGTLIFVEGALEHRLEAGDCLQLGSPEDCTFFNPGAAPCRYLIALARR